MEEKKKPAFPTQKGKHYGFGTDDLGMTLRDYFAAKAITGLTSATNQDGTWTAIGCAEEIALEAYSIADAMLTQRNKEQNQ